MSSEIREKSFTETDCHKSPFPQNLATEFLRGRLQETALQKYRYEYGASYTCFDSIAFYVDKQAITLLFLYIKPDNLIKKDLDTIEFLYHMVHDPEKGRSSKNALASMQLDVINPSTFELKHRYVQPEYRRTDLHVGSRLVEATESWLRQVAGALGHPVTVQLSTGQESVIRWAQKQGYRLVPEDRHILKEIEEHPERFIQDKVHLSEESVMLGIKKDPYLFPKESTDRYMESAVRLHFVKVISP